MFHTIDEKILAEMHILEETDREDRADGTPRLERLRQIPPETGKFLAILAAAAPKGGDYVEIGTSAGYSTLWLSLAAREQNFKIKTFEILPAKVALAKKTFQNAGSEDFIELYEEDFLKSSDTVRHISFCFLDAEKDIYEKCFDAVADKIIPGGILAADNAVNHYDAIRNMMDKALNDRRFDCITVPIGNGVFVCRRNSEK